MVADGQPVDPSIVDINLLNRFDTLFSLTLSLRPLGTPLSSNNIPEINRTIASLNGTYGIVEGYRPVTSCRVKPATGACATGACSISSDFTQPLRK